MRNAWDAEVPVAPNRAERLLQPCLDSVGEVSIELIGAGWDNTAYLVDGRWVVRFPRREIAAELMRNEARALPLLAPLLPLPVPVPVFLGEPSDEYPYPFAGYALIPGETADRVEWTEAQRAALAGPLGRFLSALHAIPDRPDWAPGDTLRKADLPYRRPWLLERLREARGLDGIDRAAIEALIERLAATPLHAGPPCWVHGDLYSRHLLVDEHRQLTGVIDWGDIHLGDPALDLSIGWTFLPPSAHERFREACGGVDKDTWQRARFTALRYGIVLADYGAATNDPAIHAAGLLALRTAS